MLTRKNVSEGGAYKEERQRRGQNKVGSQGLVHVTGWPGGEGHGQGMFEVWWKKSECERHKTQQSGGARRHVKKATDETKKKNKKYPLLVFTFFLEKMFTLRLEL